MALSVFAFARLKCGGIRVGVALWSLLTTGNLMADRLSIESAGPVSTSGSYKNLLLTSETPLSRKDFWSDLNRLRLKANIKVSDQVHVTAVIDNELLLGSLLRTPEFMFAKSLEDVRLFDLDHRIRDDEDLFWNIGFYRLLLNYSGGNTSVAIGRQSIPWGTARLWSPMDTFTPVSPLQIDRSLQPGVDALNFEHFLDSLSSVNLVLAWGDDDRDSAVRVTTNIAGYDLSALIGKFHDDRVIGFDFVGSLGGSGLRGEITFTDSEERKEFTRAVMSWDYSFPSTLYLLLEYYYNGGNLGTDGIPVQQASRTNPRTLTGGFVTRNSNFVGWAVGYEPTPLSRIDSLLLFDMDGHSLAWCPGFTYNVLPNLDWSLRLQLFSGKSDSEFGWMQKTLYSSLEWFF